MHSTPNLTCLIGDVIRAAEWRRSLQDGGWNAESDAAQLLSGLGIKEQYHYR